MENTNTTTAICRKVPGHYTQNSLGGGLDAISTPPIKVLIIGLGQLGFPVAKYVLERGFDTFGYDISVKAMERAEKTAGIKQSSTTNILVLFILVETVSCCCCFCPFMFIITPHRNSYP